MTKTKPCRFYAVGRCDRGKRCTFSHGPKETTPAHFKQPRLCPSSPQIGSCASGSAYSSEHSAGESHAGMAATTKLGAATEMVDTWGFIPKDGKESGIHRQVTPPSDWGAIPKDSMIHRQVTPPSDWASESDMLAQILAKIGQLDTPGSTPQRSLKDIVLQQLLTTPQSATAEDVLMPLLASIAHLFQGQSSPPQIDQSRIGRAHTIVDPRPAVEGQKKHGRVRSDGLLEQCHIPQPPQRLENNNVAFPKPPGCGVPPGILGSCVGQGITSQSADQFDVSNCDLDQLQLLAAIGARRLNMLPTQPSLDAQGQLMSAQQSTQWQMRSPGDPQHSSQNFRHNAAFDSRIASPHQTDLRTHHILPSQNNFLRNTTGSTSFQTSSSEGVNAIDTNMEAQRDINQLDWNTEVAREFLHQDPPQNQSSGAPYVGLGPVSREERLRTLSSVSSSLARLPDSGSHRLGKHKTLYHCGLTSESSSVENTTPTQEKNDIFAAPSIALDDSTSSEDLASRYGMVVKNGFLALTANNHLSDEYNAFKSQTCPDLPLLSDEDLIESSETLTSSVQCDFGTPEKKSDLHESVDLEDSYVAHRFNSPSQLKTLR